MRRTETLDGPTDDVTDYRAVPPPVATVRLRGVRAVRVVNDDDEAVLIISDGETTVEFGCGLRGPSGSAIRGAQRVVDALEAYALVLNSDLENVRPDLEGRPALDGRRSDPGARRPRLAGTSADR
jgi:hypothetical protein